MSREKNLLEKPQVFREATIMVAFRNTSGFSAEKKKGERKI